MSGFTEPKRNLSPEYEHNLRSWILQAAYRRAQRLVFDPLPRDGYVPWDRAQNWWIQVTTCYSGIEQALKWLSFLASEDPEFRRKKCAWRKESHRMVGLFRSLPDAYRKKIQMYYRASADIHGLSAIPEHFDEFVNSIDESGQIRWRYVLLEGPLYVQGEDSESPPMADPRVMLSIWGALLDCIQEEEYGKEPGRFTFHPEIVVREVEHQTAERMVRLLRGGLNARATAEEVGKPIPFVLKKKKDLGLELTDPEEIEERICQMAKDNPSA